LNFVIAVDWDGTIAEHDYPNMGALIPGSVEYLRVFVEKGAKLILNTMRSGEQLQDAIKLLEENGVKLWSVGKHPEQHVWTTSDKCLADLYIDDAAFGCPHMGLRNERDRERVDWSIVGPAVLEMIRERTYR
jgi:hypothetical protein